MIFDQLDAAGHDITLVAPMIAGVSVYHCSNCGLLVRIENEGGRDVSTYIAPLLSESTAAKCGGISASPVLTLLAQRNAQLTKDLRLASMYHALKAEMLAPLSNVSIGEIAGAFALCKSEDARRFVLQLLGLSACSKCDFIVCRCSETAVPEQRSSEAVLETKSVAQFLTCNVCEVHYHTCNHVQKALAALLDPQRSNDAKSVAEGKTCTHDWRCIESDDQAEQSLVQCKECGVEQMHKLPRTNEAPLVCAHQSWRAITHMTQHGNTVGVAKWCELCGAICQSSYRYPDVWQAPKQRSETALPEEKKP